MPQTIKPATPLPWTQSNQIGGNGDRFIISADAERYPVSRAEPKDAAYIVTACNAYPRLVEALSRCVELGSRSIAYPRSDDKRRDLTHYPPPDRRETK